MADIMSQAERSERMSRVRNKDTKPEVLVRRLLHAMGYRFRLHDKKLPGKPDIVLSRHKKAILVHGCFWHRHGVCRTLSIPENNPDFWARKFEENIRRDGEKVTALRDAGWQVLVVWECETKQGRMEGILRAFLAESQDAPK